jgi:hypothetical protein
MVPRSSVSTSVSSWGARLNLWPNLFGPNISPRVYAMILEGHKLNPSIVSAGVGDMSLSTFWKPSDDSLPPVRDRCLGWSSVGRMGLEPSGGGSLASRRESSDKSLSRHAWSPRVGNCASPLWCMPFSRSHICQISFIISTWLSYLSKVFCHLLGLSWRFFYPHCTSLFCDSDCSRFLILLWHFFLQACPFSFLIFFVEANYTETLHNFPLIFESILTSPYLSRDTFPSCLSLNLSAPEYQLISISQYLPASSFFVLLQPATCFFLFRTSSGSVLAILGLSHLDILSNPCAFFRCSTLLSWYQHYKWFYPLCFVLHDLFLGSGGSFLLFFCFVLYLYYAFIGLFIFPSFVVFTVKFGVTDLFNLCPWVGY